MLYSGNALKRFSLARDLALGQLGVDHLIT
jgi:hypothetical protein